LLSGNCHVDDARNSVVREFLASDCTELVFIDADVSWEPETLV
jgi:acetone carboxylase gamma subunit